MVENVQHEAGGRGLLIVRSLRCSRRKWRRYVEEFMIVNWLRLENASRSTEEDLDLPLLSGTDGGGGWNEPLEK